MAPLQTQMAKTVASAAGLTGSLPTAEAHSDLASETPIEPRKGKRPAPVLASFRKKTGTVVAENRLKQKSRQSLQNTNKMKRLAFSAAFALTITAALLAGCKKDNELKVNELHVETDSQIIDAIIETGDPGIPFPQGSKVTKERNGSYVITLPEGYFYLVAPTDERGANQPDETQIIGVNCNCTEGSGCDPATFDGKLYCIMKSGCNNCIRSNILEKGKGETENVEILGLLNRNVGITLLCDHDVPETDDDMSLGRKIIRGVEVIHGNAFEELFEITEVYDYFDHLSDCFMESGTSPNVLAFMNIYGNVALMPFYVENGESVYYAEGIHYYAKTVGGDNQLPICNCGSSDKGNKCELEKINLWPYGTGYRCNSSGCKSCTMLIQ